MSHTATDITRRQNFRRAWGPADNGECSGQDDVIFELTTGYEGDVTPSGRIPHIEITYYVREVEGADTNQPGDETLWAVDCLSHTYLLDPASTYPDDPSEDDFDYEGGSDLWYWSAEEAIRVCRDKFAKYDESWKLNDWTPA